MGGSSSKELQETIKQMNETLKNDLQEAQKRFETLKQENETREHDLQKFPEIFETLKQKNETLKNDLQKFPERFETLKQKNETLTNDLQDVGKKINLQDVGKKINSKEVQKRFETLQQEKDKLTQDLWDVEEKINMLEVQVKFNAVGYVLEREWREILKATVEVTLRPDLAHRSLTVSKNKIITFTGEESVVWPIVRDSEGFTSGRHYWEVKVEEKGYWALGVSTHPDEKNIPEKPEEGYWLLRLGGGKYEAVSRSIVTISLPGKKLRKVGVCLDYDEKKIAFYNIVDTNIRFHIHSIECGLSGQVYPIFSPGSQDRDPLIISTGNT